MAANFKNYSANGVGTSNTTLYNPSSSGIQSIVIGLTLANKSGSAVTASVLLNTGSNVTYIIKDGLITVGTSLVPVGGGTKLVLEQNDSLVVIANTANSVDATLSVLEIT